MTYPCVPFNPAFTGSTKLDLKAIYERANGDMAALPMRRHDDWVRKGMTYVTLADPESLAAAAPFLGDVRTYIVGRDGDGKPTPWNPARYQAERAEQRSADEAALAELVAAHGVEAVEKIRGQAVPEHLKATKRKGQAG